MHARDLTRYRPNVGIALFNRLGLVFVGQRVGFSGPYAWQMPQGGIDRGEDFAEAALRELHEEVGVDASLAEPLGQTEDWLAYDFPAGEDGRFRGQKQRWFAFRFRGRDADIRLDLHKPEFSNWRWATLAETPGLVVPFKRAVYEEIARRFARFAVPLD